jgi:hypothetical protein
MRYSIQAKHKNDLDWSWRFDTNNKYEALHKLDEMVNTSESPETTYRVINNFTNQILDEKTIYG